MPADSGLTRRQILVGGAAATGYALAAGPVHASAIHTPADGLKVGMVEIAVPGAPMRAYRAAPALGESLPIVLVVHEIFGLHEYVRDVCRRLAQQGYLAIAPDLYRRVGDPATLTEVGELIDKIVSRVPDAGVLTDLDATLAWAGAERGDTDRAFITGFCWGGRIVWLYAAHRPELSGGAAWYGRLEGESNNSHPVHPLDLAAGKLAPVLGLYGSADRGIPLSSVQLMRRKLAEAGQASDILVFPAAPHGFHADYRASYRDLAAHEGWARMLGWFGERGGVPQPARPPLPPRPAGIATDDN
jgi:carboxymethylenebutenolidase